MKIEHLTIVIIGIVLFLYSYDLRASFSKVAFVWVLGIVLVYLGLKLEQDLKKKMKK